MALTVKTKHLPKELLDKFRREIMTNNIHTWIIDDEGDITVARPQWRYKAWMRCSYCNEERNELIFGIVETHEYKMTRELYAVYHGRLVATLLSLFDDEVEDVSVSPLLMADIDIFDTEIFR